MLKTIIKKIFNWLNIKPDENQKYLIASMFFSGLLITYSSPTITKAIISDLPAEWLAIDSLTSSLSALFIGMMWKGKVRERAIKWFFYLTIGESVLGCLLGLYLAFVEYNVWVYAIVSLIYTNFISIFVGKCIMVFRTKLWNEHKREEYDNNASIVSSIVCAIGYICALLFLPSLKVALFLWSVCCILDDCGWIYVYHKNQKLLKT